MNRGQFQYLRLNRLIQELGKPEQKESQKIQVEIEEVLKNLETLRSLISSKLDLESRENPDLEPGENTALKPQENPDLTLLCQMLLPTAMQLLPQFSVNNLDEKGKNSLHYAVLFRQHEIMQRLLDPKIGAKVDIKGGNSISPLGLAFEAGDEKAIDILLPRSETPYLPALNPETDKMEVFACCPMHLVFRDREGKPKADATVKKLLEKLFEKQKPSQNFLNFALRDAVALRMPTVITLLKTAGAEISEDVLNEILKQESFDAELFITVFENTRLKPGSTVTWNWNNALSKSLGQAKTNPRVIKILVERGAEVVNLQIFIEQVAQADRFYDRPSRSPIIHLLEDPRFAKERFELVEALFSGRQKPDILVNLRKPFRTAIQIVLEDKEFDSRYVELFLKSGLELHEQFYICKNAESSSILTTPLHFAIEMHAEQKLPLDKFKALLGLNVPATEEKGTPKWDACRGKSNGLTPLMLAIHLNDPEAVELLLTAGASPNTCINDISPLQLALNENAPETIIKALVRAGAIVEESSLMALMNNEKVSEASFLSYLQFFVNPQDNMDAPKRSGEMKDQKLNPPVQNAKPLNQELLPLIFCRAIHNQWHTVAEWIYKTYPNILDFNKAPPANYNAFKTLFGCLVKLGSFELLCKVLKEKAADLKSDTTEELLNQQNRFNESEFRIILGFIHHKNILQKYNKPGLKQLLIVERMTTLKQQENFELEEINRVSTAITTETKEQKVDDGIKAIRIYTQQEATDLDFSIVDLTKTTKAMLANKLFCSIEVAYKLYGKAETKMAAEQIIRYITNTLWVQRDQNLWDILLIPISNVHSHQNPEKPLLWHLARKKDPKDFTKELLTAFFSGFPVPSVIPNIIENSMFSGVLSEVESLQHQHLPKQENPLLALYFFCFKNVPCKGNADQKAFAKIGFLKICALLSGKDNGDRSHGKERWQVDVLQMLEIVQEHPQLRGTFYAGFFHQLRIAFVSPKTRTDFYQSLLSYLGPAQAEFMRSMDLVKVPDRVFYPPPISAFEPLVTAPPSAPAPEGHPGGTARSAPAPEEHPGGTAPSAPKPEGHPGRTAPPAPNTPEGHPRGTAPPLAPGGPS